MSKLDEDLLNSHRNTQFVLLNPKKVVVERCSQCKEINFDVFGK
jgi:hypothetical protein